MKKKILIGLLVFCQGMANVVNAQTLVFYESFDKCNGEGGNDGKWSNISLNPYEKIENAYLDNKGWSFENSHKGDKCLIIGNSDKKGIATTPSIGIIGNGTLKFKTGGWNTANELNEIQISISGGGTLNQKNIILTKAVFEEYTIQITNLTSSSKITFAAKQSNKNRFFLDEVMVFSGTPATSTLSISESQYATIYLNDAFVMPEGVTGHTISDAQGRVTYGTTYTKGDVVPAQTPLLLEGAQGTYTYYTTTTTATAPTNNMLRGSTGEMVDDSGYLYYKLCYKSASDKTVGFFWDTADGHSINIGAGKAYLAVPESSGAKGYTFDDAITGISAVPCQQENDSGNHAIREQSSVDDRIFDLYGRCVGRGAPSLHTPNLPKGIYIYQGKRISTF